MWRYDHGFDRIFYVDICMLSFNKYVSEFLAIFTPFTVNCCPVTLVNAKFLYEAENDELKL